MASYCPSPKLATYTTPPRTRLFRRIRRDALIRDVFDNLFKLWDAEDRVRQLQEEFRNQPDCDRQSLDPSV
jgi:hypothetical protein